MLAARQRARRAGTRPRTDHTIETALATVRDLARFLACLRGKQDWALADVHDIEAFLATLPKARKRRLTVLRQFFRLARTRKIILAHPTRTLAAAAPRGFTGQTIALDQQRALFRRWTTGTDAHPHEALLGILALLHGASSSEIRHLHVSHIDADGRTVRLGKRPHPVPLDPASWQVLQRCLAHRDGQYTANPHVIVTKGTKAGAGTRIRGLYEPRPGPLRRPAPHAALHPPGRPGQHHGPQARRRRVRHEPRRRHDLPGRPR